MNELTLALLRDGAVLTRDSKDPANPEAEHPLVVTRPSGEKGFKLQLHDVNPSAPLSPYFFNIRVSNNPTKPGTVTLETVLLAAQCMLSKVIDSRIGTFDYVVGIPNAGDPFASALTSLIAGVPLLKLIKSNEGGKRAITGLEGMIPTVGSKVLVVDDLITAAGSKFLGIDVLVEKYGLVVNDVVVIVDRVQGGREGLAERGITLHSLFTTAELMEIYGKQGAISGDTYAVIMQYIADQTKK